MNGVEKAAVSDQQSAFSSDQTTSGKRAASLILEKVRSSVAIAMRVCGGIIFLFAMIFGMIAAVLSMKKASAGGYEGAAVSGQRSAVALEEPPEKAAVLVSSSD